MLHSTPMRSTLGSLKLPKEYPSPAVKWLGGKAELADTIIPLLPHDVRARRWHEPCAGGGAMFFRLLPRRAVLSDTCADLIGFYEALQAGPSESFLMQLFRLQTVHTPTNAREQYEGIRKLYNEHQHADAEQRAAWFLYLNRTGFNGLHRVNNKGEFNTPFGDIPRFKFDTGNLSTCATALASAELHCEGFEGVLERASKGDVVYFDPPYLGTFSGYSGTFGLDEHVRLRDVFRMLDERGVITVLSISDEPVIRELYEGFEVVVIRAGRCVGARGASRGSVDELVIRGHMR
jgi:DNA adenine methylase